METLSHTAINQLRCESVLSPIPDVYYECGENPHHDCGPNPTPCTDTEHTILW